MQDEIYTHSWVIILFIYDANIVYIRYRRIGGKGSENCMKLSEGMRFKDDIIRLGIDTGLLSILFFC